MLRAGAQQNIVAKCMLEEELVAKCTKWRGGPPPMMLEEVAGGWGGRQPPHDARRSDDSIRRAMQILFSRVKA